MSWRCDPEARIIADRHYNRQSIGAPNFAPPGRCLVLKALSPARALWVTSWPFAEYVKHAWPGAWVCSAFRNEGAGLSSELIREAVAVTRWRWPEIPTLGMITFVDTRHVQSANPGYCYKRAGFEACGMTKGGLHALQLLPGAMPDPLEPIGCQQLLFG
jgi:hypothetical protein